MASVEPLYERFGGVTAVAGLVFDFYDRVMKSRQLARYFADVDMSRLIDHQTKFLCSVMGGPPSYTNEQLREVHAPLGITGEDFDEMVRLLHGSLKAFGMSGDDLDFTLSEIRARRPYIVGSSEDRPH
jgi:hemoglobin